MSASELPEPGPIGVLCALPQELALLEDALADQVAMPSAGLAAHSGRLDGHRVVLAEAGVGKVNAATTATILADRFGCTALILSGVAGGLSDALDIGDLVVADRVIDIDYGRITDEARILYQPGSLPFPGVTAKPGYQLPGSIRQRLVTDLSGYEGRVVVGTIVSGDAFLSSPRVRDLLVGDWSALAVEMEGAAVCGVAERFGLPWLIVRALSDRAGEDSAMDFDTFVSSAAAASATLVRRLLPVVSPAR